MTDPRETLAHIRAQADAATPGPWETDGTGEVSQHWSRPKPWETVVGTGVSCMSYCYGGSAKGVERVEDAAFIAASRTDVPALVDALEAVLKLHVRAECPTCGSRDGEGNEFHKCDDDAYCEECDLEGYPCPTVEAITAVLEGEPHD